MENKRVTTGWHSLSEASLFSMTLLKDFSEHVNSMPPSGSLPSHLTTSHEQSTVSLNPAWHTHTLEEEASRVGDQMHHTLTRWVRLESISETSFHKFLSILRQCGVTSTSTSIASRDKAPLPSSRSDLVSDPRFFAFHPLFTPYFDFQNQQLTTLGDTVIDCYLSDTILDYCAHTGLILTVNAARQLNAVFHNHFSLQLFASEFGFADLAIPVGGSPDSSPDAVHGGLDFLVAHRVGVTHRDTAGTSFHLTPLPSGQSPLGWKLSHFIGATHTIIGPQAARAALERMYGLDGAGNIMARASTLLTTLLEHFPAANVAEAVLAAQGLPARFVGKTRLIAEEEQESSGENRSGSSRNGGGEGSPHAASAGIATASEDAYPLALIGFGSTVGEGPNSPTASAASLDALAASKETRTTLANGPGLVDYTRRWQARTAALVAKNAEPNPLEAISSGWLSEEEQRRSQRGPAFAHAVDITARLLYADIYGPPQPEDGKIVARRKFKRSVRDPLFYDKVSDMRNGVPLNTDGEPLHAYLDSFLRPHRRLFEVTMLAGNGEGRLVGRAIATRYTVARDSACKAYLGGVLKDLAELSASDRRAQGVDEVSQ